MDHLVVNDFPISRLEADRTCSGNLFCRRIKCLEFFLFDFFIEGLPSWYWEVPHKADFIRFEPGVGFEQLKWTSCGSFSEYLTQFS